VVAPLWFCAARLLVYQRSWRVFTGPVSEGTEPVSDATDLVEEPFTFAAQRCDLILEALQLAAGGLSNTADVALGISNAALGLVEGVALGRVCALVRCDQDRRDLRPDAVNLSSGFASRRGTLQLRKLVIELNDLLLELAEALIDDRAVVPLPRNWEARRGFLTAWPISGVGMTT
jgi:hypothetical protein